MCLFQLNQLYFITLALLVCIFNGIPGILGGIRHIYHYPTKKISQRRRVFLEVFLRSSIMDVLPSHIGVTITQLLLWTNDVPSGKAHWKIMEVRSKGDFEIMHVPLVASIYKKVRASIGRLRLSM